MERREPPDGDAICVTKWERPVSAAAPREAQGNANLASTPLIFHIPHASIAIPPEARRGVAVTDAELAIELLHMTDRYTDEIFKQLFAKATRLSSFQSRAWSWTRALR